MLHSVIFFSSLIVMDPITTNWRICNEIYRFFCRCCNIGRNQESSCNVGKKIARTSRPCGVSIFADTGMGSGSFVSWRKKILSRRLFDRNMWTGSESVFHKLCYSYIDGRIFGSRPSADAHRHKSEYSMDRDFGCLRFFVSRLRVEFYERDVLLLRFAGHIEIQGWPDYAF